MGKLEAAHRERIALRRIQLEAQTTYQVLLDSSKFISVFRDTEFIVVVKRKIHFTRKDKFRSPPLDIRLVSKNTSKKSQQALEKINTNKFHFRTPIFKTEVHK